MPSFSFLVVLVLSLLVGGVVQVNGSSEKKKMENYWWSSSSHLPNGAAQKRWKRDDGAILKEVSSSTMGGSSDDVTQINFQDSKSEMMSSTESTIKPQPQRKFGLAWLFSSVTQMENEITDDQETKVNDIDEERIRGTWLTLEATKKERRVEAQTRQFSQNWQPIAWPQNCTDPIPEITVAKQQETPAKEVSSPDETTDAKEHLKFEVMSEDTLELKCSFYNVHHEVDMDRFSVEWIASGRHHSKPSNNPKAEEMDDQQCQDRLDSAPKLIKTERPKCRLSTEFPFEDLKSSIMNISCHSILTLENVTINETAIYTCRARIAFTPMPAEDDEEVLRNRRNLPDQEEPFKSMNYEMSAQLLIRVSRRNDYYVHKIVSLVIGSVVTITLLFLVGKKVLGHKLGWESKEGCNYAPEWPNAVPARGFASAGSLHQSRSTLRRPSEPCIAEEEGEEDVYDNYNRSRKHRIDSDTCYNSDTLEEEDEELMEEDGGEAEITEFLRKVKSSSSFKIIIGDESPRPLPKNPLERVAKT